MFALSNNCTVPILIAGTMNGAYVFLTDWQTVIDYEFFILLDVLVLFTITSKCIIYGKCYHYLKRHDKKLEAYDQKSGASSMSARTPPVNPKIMTSLSLPETPNVPRRAKRFKRPNKPTRKDQNLHEASKSVQSRLVHFFNILS